MDTRGYQAFIREDQHVCLEDLDSLQYNEDLYSSLLLGLTSHETVQRLIESDVLISGMQALGIEIAKNLILAGVRSVTLHDEDEVKLSDLSGSFVFTKDDVGNNRAQVASEKLQNVNYHVTVFSHASVLTKDFIANFQAVVITNSSISKVYEIGIFCRNHNPPILFIKSDVEEMLGDLFCDFSSSDVDGNIIQKGLVVSTNPDSVTYAENKVSVQLKFQFFERALGDTGYQLKGSTAGYLHLSYQTSDKFIIQFGRFPEPRGEAADNNMDRGWFGKMDADIIRHFAFVARTVSNPMSAIFGAIVADVVFKIAAMTRDV